MKNNIKTKDGYFNLEGWLNLINVDYTKDKHICIITAERNNGKSFSSWNFIVKNIWEKYNYTKKVAIARTNDLRMKESLSSFKAYYFKEYEVINGYIYKIFRDEKDNIIKDKKIEVGRFVNIENEHNYRSGAGCSFDGYCFLFWDEFNETKQVGIDLFKKFNMLISTIERYNNPFIVLLLGNKINANNDIFIKYNLNVNRKDLNNDYIQRVGNRITYIDVGYNTYKNLNQVSSLVNESATYDEATNRLFNEGGFLEGTFYNVLNKMNFTNKKIKYYFSLDNVLIEYGTFTNPDVENGKELNYLSEVKTPNENIPILALNIVGYAKHGIIIEKDDLISLSNIIFYQIQNKEIYFSSFYLMDLMEKWIYKNSNVFNDDMVK